MLKGKKNVVLFHQSQIHYYYLFIVCTVLYVFTTLYNVTVTTRATEQQAIKLFI